MTNRIIIGQKNIGEYGLWVSRLGYDVLTTSDSNLLFSMSGAYLQVLQQGEFTIGSGTNPYLNISLSGTNGISPFVYVFIKDSYDVGTRVYNINASMNVVASSSNLNIALDGYHSSTTQGSYICFYDGE